MIGIYPKQRNYYIHKFHPTYHANLPLAVNVSPYKYCLYCHSIDSIIDDKPSGFRMCTVCDGI